HIGRADRLLRAAGIRQCRLARHQPVRPVRRRARQGHGEGDGRRCRPRLRSFHRGPDRPRIRRLTGMTKAYDYDLFVIGAGSGGVRASRVAASHGARVAVAEEFRVGGTCVIRGCVPKKMLVYGAHFAEDLQDAKAFGWTVENPTFDWKTLRDNVLRDVDRLNGLYTQTLENHGVEMINEDRKSTRLN